MNLTTAPTAKRHALCAAFIFTALLADQLTKWLAYNTFHLRCCLTDGMRSVDFLSFLTNMNLPRIDFDRIEALPFFNLTMVWNEGVSFGMMNSGTPYMVWGLTAMALIMAASFTVWLIKTDRALMVAALSLVISGAIGNVLDRVRFGAVIDFLDFHAGRLHWPAFNVADSLIVVGVAILALDSLLLDNKKQM
jgi:signal peptidase II